MTQPDHPQKAHFSALFDRSADTYDAVGVDFFEPLAEALVRRAGLRSGMSVLDVGTGSGASLRAAAAAVGGTGEVHVHRRAEQLQDELPRDPDALVLGADAHAH